MTRPNGGRRGARTEAEGARECLSAVPDMWEQDRVRCRQHMCDAMHHALNTHSSP